MIDAEIRQSAFLWLRERVLRNDYVVPRSVLTSDFAVRGTPITLVGATGIWKPRMCHLPLSITSVSNGPYDDSFTDDGLLVYRYRGNDPNHRDNAGLRELMRTRTPLIYFHGIMPGKYVPVWPVFVVEDMPGQLACEVAVDPAYSHTCVLCRLQHASLLDAAHIISDSSPGGDPVVNNGLCLCKIHHAAYDQSFLGISPDYRVHVRSDILSESDGPMLLHGLQETHGQSIVLPTRKEDYPDRERLDRRFSEFLSA